MGAALRSGGYKGRITGCDITLYTTALGAYLAGHDLEIREKEDCPEHLKGFLDFSNMAHLAASVSIHAGLAAGMAEQKRMAQTSHCQLQA